MKVVVAPNPFKGTLSAAEAARAIARGVREAWPDAEIVEVPVADGGEGTVDALVAAAGGTLRAVTVEGPLGDPVRAAWGDLGGGRAAVELASSSGLPLVARERRDPRLASTFGFGSLLADVFRAGAMDVVAGIGGSATNDAASGMAQALGYRLEDASGRELERGGAALARLARVVPPSERPWEGLRLRVAIDVTNPLLGPRGASAVYGPQKGAGPEAVRELDAALARWADVVERDLGRAVRDLPGAGAAGGAGAGLVAFLGAELTRGAPLVVEAAGLDAALEGAGLAITGEGRADAQTAYGKGPAEVTERALARGVRVLHLAGSLGEGWRELLRPGVAGVVEAGGGEPAGAEEAAERLAAAARRACAGLEPA